MNTPTETTATRAGQRKRRSRNRYKPAIRSRTIAAALSIIIVNIAALGRWAVSAENASIVVEAAITIASAGYVIWCRFHARDRVRGLLRSSKQSKNG